MLKIEQLQDVGNFIPHVSELPGYSYIDVEHLEFLYSRFALTKNEEVLFSLLIKCAQSFNGQKEFGYK